MAWESCHRVVCLGQGLATATAQGLVPGPRPYESPSWRLLHPPLANGYDSDGSSDIGVLGSQYVFLGDTTRPQVATDRASDLLFTIFSITPVSLVLPNYIGLCYSITTPHHSNRLVCCYCDSLSL